ncbi:Protein vip1 [Dispira simplex]|nr:Protein vip1 [Dispira simplex]
MASWTGITFSEEPSPNFVLVRGISPTATEEKVKEFFNFCGTMDGFALRPSLTGEAQEALIRFEKDSAAKTAVLLSNAMIEEQPIEVKYYYNEFNTPVSPSVPQDAKAADSENQRHIGEAAELLKNQDIPQEDKPKSSIIHEILAKGYLLSERIVGKAYEYDSKYGLTEKAQAMVNQAKQGALALDQRLKVSENIKQIDEKYKLHDKVTNLTTQASNLGNQALGTSAGQTIVNALQQAKEQGSQTYQESVKLAEEMKRHEQPGAGTSSPAAVPEPSTSTQ